MDHGYGPEFNPFVSNIVDAGRGYRIYKICLRQCVTISNKFTQDKIIKFRIPRTKRFVLFISYAYYTLRYAHTVIISLIIESEQRTSTKAANKDL